MKLLEQIRQANDLSLNILNAVSAILDKTDGVINSDVQEIIYLILSKLLSYDNDSIIIDTIGETALNRFINSLFTSLSKSLDNGYGISNLQKLSDLTAKAYTFQQLGMLNLVDSFKFLKHFVSEINVVVEEEVVLKDSGVSGVLSKVNPNSFDLEVTDILPNLGENVITDVVEYSGVLDLGNGLSKIEYMGEVANPSINGNFDKATATIRFNNLPYGFSAFDVIAVALYKNEIGKINAPKEINEETLNQRGFGIDNISELSELGGSVITNSLKQSAMTYIQSHPIGYLAMNTKITAEGVEVKLPLVGNVGFKNGKLEFGAKINNMVQMVKSIEPRVNFVKTSMSSIQTSMTNMVTTLFNSIKKSKEYKNEYNIKTSDYTTNSLGIRTNNFIEILKKSVCGGSAKSFLEPISILYALSIRGPYNPLLYRQLAKLTISMIEASGMSDIDTSKLTNSDRVVSTTFNTKDGSSSSLGTVQVVRNWYESVLKKYQTSSSRGEWDICGLNKEGDTCTTIGKFLDLQKINTTLSEGGGAQERAQVVNEKQKNWASKLYEFLGITRSSNEYTVEKQTINGVQQDIFLLETDFENLYDCDSDVSYDSTDDYCCLEPNVWDEIITALKSDDINDCTKAIIVHILQNAELRILPKVPEVIFEPQVALPVPAIPFPPPPTSYFTKNNIDFNKTCGANEYRNLLASWSSMAEKSMQISISDTVRDATLLANQIEKYSPDVARQLRHKLKNLHPNVVSELEGITTMQEISEYVGAWLFGLEADKSNVLLDEWKSLPINIRTPLRPRVKKSFLEMSQLAYQKTNSLMYNILAKTLAKGEVVPIVHMGVAVEIEDEKINDFSVNNRSLPRYSIIKVYRNLTGKVNEVSSYKVEGNCLDAKFSDVVNEVIKKKLPIQAIRYYILGSDGKGKVELLGDITKDYIKNDGIITSENKYTVTSNDTSSSTFNKTTFDEIRKLYKWNVKESQMEYVDSFITESFYENKTCDINVKNKVPNIPPYLDLAKLKKEPNDVWSPFHYGFKCNYGPDGEYHMYIMRYSKGDDLRGVIETEVDKCFWQMACTDRQSLLYYSYILPSLQGEYIGSDIVNTYIDKRTLYSVEIEDREKYFRTPHDLYLWGDVEYRWFHTKYQRGAYDAMKVICSIIDKRIINLNYLYRVLNKVRQDYNPNFVICDDSVVEFTKTGHQAPKKFTKLDKEGIN